MKIVVTPYNEQWPIQFQEIKEQLCYALSDFLPTDRFRIEHVGSTSVPGLAAKPIIDIDIVVAAQDILEACQALTSYGHTYAYEAGGLDRMVFRFNQHKLDSGASTPTEDGMPRRAIYLNKQDGASLMNHLAVRKVLRENADLVKEYGDLKLALAQSEYVEITNYASQKSALLARILDKSGLSQEELQRIMHLPKRRIDPIIRLEKTRAAEERMRRETSQL